MNHADLCFGPLKILPQCQFCLPPIAKLFAGMLFQGTAAGRRISEQQVSKGAVTGTVMQKGEIDIVGKVIITDTLL